MFKWALLIFVAAILLGDVLALAGQSERVSGVVERVVDGDTVHVWAKFEKPPRVHLVVRLADIDAPEKRRAGRGGGHGIFTGKSRGPGSDRGNSVDQVGALAAGILRAGDRPDLSSGPGRGFGNAQSGPGKKIRGMNMEKTGINSIYQMLDVLAFREDPAFPGIVEQIIEAFKKYREDLLIKLDGGQLIVKKSDGKPLQTALDFSADKVESEYRG